MGDLSIQDLVVEYAGGADTVRPIDGLNLDVAAGSLVILLGPSGCGKTTLLSCLGGILRPSGGAIKFGDVDVTSLEARGLSTYRRETVGIVFQAFNLVPSLTALENVMVPLLRGGHAAPRGPQACRTAAGTGRPGGTDDPPARRPQRRSQQRVAVARAIALDPPLDVGRRADRAPGLHSGRGSITAHTRTRLRRPNGGRRDPRQQDSAAGRSRRRTRSRLRVHGPAARDRASWRPAKCCSSRARWAS